MVYSSGLGACKLWVNTALTGGLVVVGGGGFLSLSSLLLGASAAVSLGDDDVRRLQLVLSLQGVSD
jgi:hypothetical protein